MEQEKKLQESRIEVFEELMTCGHTIYSWSYNTQGDLLRTNCSGMAGHHILTRSGCLQYVLEHIPELRVPVCVGTQLGMLWGAVQDYSDASGTIYLIGPVISTEIPSKTITRAARYIIKEPAMRVFFEEFLRNLSVVPIFLFQEYLLMLYYCVNGERLNVSDIHFQRSSSTGIQPGGAEKPHADRQHTYMAERALLHCVREGDLNYQSALSRAASLSRGVRIQADNPIYQAILSASGFITLCTRAAIEGGLSPDTAYTVGDSYIQSLLSCKSVSEVGAINHTMYEDFIRRVRMQRDSIPLSKQIRKCKDYIELHPEEDLSLKRLSSMAGYTEYHFSRKFKTEVGESINDYINNVRIGKAKILLETTSMPISEIAASLHFCSSAYFSDRFRTVTGMLPSAYRKEKQVR